MIPYISYMSQRKDFIIFQRSQFTNIRKDYKRMGWVTLGGIAFPTKIYQTLKNKDHKMVNITSTQIQVKSQTHIINLQSKQLPQQVKTMLYKISTRSPAETDWFKMEILSQTSGTYFRNLLSHLLWTTHKNSHTRTFHAK